MSDEYIIRVTRVIPAHLPASGSEQTHYYERMSDDGKQYHYVSTKKEILKTNEFTEQEVKKIIKEIELIIYGENSETNGILLKIEILESGTFKHVNMRKFRVITSRFELMDL